MPTLSTAVFGQQEVRRLSDAVARGEQSRFGVVLCSHSLHWISRPINILGSSLKPLAPEGEIPLFLQGPPDVWHLHQVFAARLHRDQPVGPDHGLHGFTIASGLKERGHQASVHASTRWL